jgi:DNA processing protein
MVDQRASYIALVLTPGIGPARLATILEACETPDGARSAPFEFLCHLPGLSRAAATAIRASRPEEGIRVLERTAELGGRCLLPGDAEFPEHLNQIPEPPPLLFTLGDLAVLRPPAVAVVGSRDHSPYGEEVCRLLVRGAAGHGIVVVSGMARGLDAVAHAAALEAEGGTIGVLGNGLGVVYPAANRLLYERVAECGLLVTEFPPGERPRHGSFPRRNRLISGLASVVVVVEAAAGSGTLITVEAALAQGREVMAVPGSILSGTSVGTNRLIRDGATPYLEPTDLLAQFPGLVVRPPEKVAVAPQLPLPVVSGEEGVVLASLSPTPLHLDDLATATGMPVGHLLGVLCGLEVAGHVEQLPARRFRRM